jgi:hypothetical protein
MHAIQQATTHVGNIINTGPTVKTLSVLDKYKYVADAQFTLQVNLVHKPDYKHAVIIPTITAVTATFKGVNPLTALTEVGNNGLVYLTV